MVVACLALIVAIGGSAYAASKINGKDIRKDSITGKQIKEKTVKKVASAKKATTAKTASMANTRSASPARTPMTSRCDGCCSTRRAGSRSNPVVSA